MALSILDPENPYRYIQVRGRVGHVTEKGADAHINSLAKKYLGKDKYPWAQPDQIRVIFEIEPDKVQVKDDRVAREPDGLSTARKLVTCDARCSAVKSRISRRGFKQAFIIAAAGLRDDELSRNSVCLRYWSVAGHEIS